MCIGFWWFCYVFVNLCIYCDFREFWVFYCFDVFLRCIGLVVYGLVIVLGCVVVFVGWCNVANWRFLVLLCFGCFRCRVFVDFVGFGFVLTWFWVFNFMVGF